MTRREALDTLRMALAPVTNPVTREHIYQAAVAYGHACAVETLDECKRVIHNSFGKPEDFDVAGSATFRSTHKGDQSS